MSDPLLKVTGSTALILESSKALECLPRLLKEQDAELVEVHIVENEVIRALIWHEEEGEFQDFVWNFETWVPE